jgi:3-dehydroquinate dehydratase/shikimate dehydrogenase
MSRICVSSHHRGLGELLRDAEFAELARREDMLIELRLDQYADLSVQGLTSAIQRFGPGALVVTFRSADEGGRSPAATDAQRLHYLSVATSFRAAYVDIELSTLQRNGDAWRELLSTRRDEAPQFVVSFHDLAGTPPLDKLRAIRRAAEEAGADVVKTATGAQTVHQTRPVLDLLCEAGWRRPLLALAMGEAGFWTRVMGPLLPLAAPFTFARGQAAPGTALGQPTWRELAELYRFPQLRPGDPVYAVIGNPIAHSLSPLMHNAALAQLGLRGVYVPFRVEQDPAGFVGEMAPKLGLRGISVTIPHKESVLAACAERDDLVRQIGAANTLTRRGTDAQPLWHATNTDAQAAAGCLEDALGGPGALRGRRVLILGAGGAARGIAFGLKAHQAQVLIWNRTPGRAGILAQEVGGRSVQREEIPRPELGVAAVVNTTPLGMYPKTGDSPLEADELPRGCLVFDTVYNPLRTRLLRMAQERGLRTLEGVAMFVRQGVAQFELFTGRPAPSELMEKVVRAELARREAGGAPG